MREEEFKIWLKAGGYADSVQSNYPIYVREHIPAFLNDIGVQVDNLFLLNDVSKLKEHLSYFKKDGNLYEINKSKNNFPSAALGKYIEFIKNGSEVDDSETVVQIGDNHSLIKNIILYGSPGVGKTHNTNKLISLIEEGKSDREIFEAIKKNEKSDSVDISAIKERVKFVTFHQSFGYEDFIEGFRPNEEGNIELVDGVFKQLSNEAKDNLMQSVRNDNFLYSEEKKKKIFELFIDKIQDEIDAQGKYYINQTVYIFAVEGNAFRYQGDNWKNSQRMKFSDILRIMDFPSFGRKDIKIIPNISGLAKQHATYYSYLAKQLLDFRNTVDVNIDVDVKKEELKNYYLVIDEINRGNISKIFGELITLIEEDKRDTLEVTLPYSKQPFKIPSNFYIIGTMNSTDKSIALIDIALRRRFTFLKMEPNAELITFSKAKDIFIALNEQITKDLGEDYQIGHSYFMKIESDDELKFVLDYKISPLLEEYYYGDNRLEEILALYKRDRGDN